MDYIVLYDKDTLKIKAYQLGNYDTSNCNNYVRVDEECCMYCLAMEKINDTYLTGIFNNKEFISKENICTKSGVKLNVIKSNEALEMDVLKKENEQLKQSIAELSLMVSSFLTK